jgi:hypothetical protein
MNQYNEHKPSANLSRKELLGNAAITSNNGPAYQFRKIKGASIVKPAFSQGFKNDDHIDQGEYGKVYKLSEKSIKLDFISKYVTCFS